MYTRSIFIFSFTISSLFLSAQDTMSYQRYLTRMKLPKQVVITDIFGKPYKKIETSKKKFKEQFFLSDQLATIDTVIHMDLTVKGLNSWNVNKDSVFNYIINHVISPPHGGDPNTSTVSIIVNGKGELEKVTVLENVKNACNNDWIIDNKPLRLIPINPKKFRNYIEYIVRRDDICYLECFVDPDTKSGH